MLSTVCICIMHVYVCDVCNTLARIVSPLLQFVRPAHSFAGACIVRSCTLRSKICCLCESVIPFTCLDFGKPYSVFQNKAFIRQRDLSFLPCGDHVHTTRSFTVLQMLCSFEAIRYRYLVSMTHRTSIIWSIYCFYQRWPHTVTVQLFLVDMLSCSGLHFPCTVSRGKQNDEIAVSAFILWSVWLVVN